MWLLFLALAVAGLMYTMRARSWKGVETLHTSRGWLGATVDLAQTIVFDNKKTTAEYFLDAFRHHGFRAVQWSQVGGPVCGQHSLAINHPDDVKCVLKDDFGSFEKGSSFLEKFDALLGDGIFNVNGDKWKSQRTVMSHMFSRRLLRERMSTIFGPHAQDLVQTLAPYAADATIVNIQTLFYCYTFDCINMIAFSREVNSLAGVERDVSFQQSFDIIQNNVLDRFILPWWKVNRFLGLTHERAIAKHAKLVDKYVYDVVDGYYNEAGEISDEALQGDQTMTGLFLEAAKEEGKTYDRKFLRDMILNTVIAGRDTTGSALTSCIEYLCDHPEWQDKLIEEAKEVFGGNTQEALTFDDMEDKTPISEAVFLEAIRLNPSVPVNEKVCVKQCTLPCGVTVHPGEFVHWFPNVTARRTDVWGPDAEEFNPARWLDGKAKAYDDYMYPTFNAGPRLCLGKNMAILEGKTALLTIFAHYRFTAKKGFKPTVMKSVTWQNDADGMQVHVHKL